MPTNPAQDAADAARVRVRTVTLCDTPGCRDEASPTGGGKCARHDRDRADREAEAIGMQNVEPFDECTGPMVLIYEDDMP